jgi:hypothetical protein
MSVQDTTCFALPAMRILFVFNYEIIFPDQALILLIEF